MVTTYIDSKNFEEKFKKILKSKTRKKVAKGRFDIETIPLNIRADFIIRWLHSFKTTLGLTYKILFWENDEKIQSLIKTNFPNKDYYITISYKNSRSPGIVYLDDKIIHNKFLKILLDRLCP